VSSEGGGGPNVQDGTNSWGSGVGGVGIYRVSAAEWMVSKGNNVGKPQTLTLPPGPRRDRRSRLRLGGRCLGLFLARSLLDRPPNRLNRLERSFWGRLLDLFLARSWFDGPPSWTSRLGKCLMLVCARWYVGPHCDAEGHTGIWCYFWSHRSVNHYFWDQCQRTGKYGKLMNRYWGCLDLTLTRDLEILVWLILEAAR